MNKKIFIAFEGIDGSGKSTQASLLAATLQQQGHLVHHTFEPTDSVIGKIIRNIFKGEMQANHNTIAALFAADRLHHLQNETDGIIKNLNDGFVVISDRYYFSSYAYHSVHVPMNWVIKTNELSAALLKPTITFYIDVDPEVCMQRINANRTSTEIYETLDNLKQVQQQYFKAFELLRNEENICIINGNNSPEKIAQNIYEKFVELCL